ncbi:ABC transporter, nucleotide binding/ATPase domain protein [Micavibrio aeruginosavorus ARL-13]|uniref:ABC transporter, nucleotide binding/ATPase domain protein n=1 Tax=Micavibrio aeruginosavorus (strain ARL-13) TaxID=856793 RepID=G2KQC3_MICAA|nr:ABC transporter, nucleotide binding/ATPase domain protein [Micavibrio aeruginosavorus ARL-13]
MDKAVTDFPDPLSPTNATVSPADTEKDVFLTAWDGPDGVWKLMLRS